MSKLKLIDCDSFCGLRLSMLASATFELSVDDSKLKINYEQLLALGLMIEKVNGAIKDSELEEFAWSGVL